jgi:hypothetical protein
MDVFGLESAELLRIVVVGVVLLIGLGVLRFVLKLTARVLTGGCLAIILILAALVVTASVN